MEEEAKEDAVHVGHKLVLDMVLDSVVLEMDIFGAFVAKPIHKIII